MAKEERGHENVGTPTVPEASASSETRATRTHGSGEPIPTGGGFRSTGVAGVPGGVPGGVAGGEGPAKEVPNMFIRSGRAPLYRTPVNPDAPVVEYKYTEKELANMKLEIPGYSVEEAEELVAAKKTENDTKAALIDTDAKVRLAAESNKRIKLHPEASEEVEVKFYGTRNSKEMTKAELMLMDDKLREKTAYMDVVIIDDHSLRGLAAAFPKRDTVLLPVDVVYNMLEEGVIIHQLVGEEGKEEYKQLVLDYVSITEDAPEPKISTIDATKAKADKLATDAAKTAKDNVKPNILAKIQGYNINENMFKTLSRREANDLYNTYSRALDGLRWEILSPSLELSDEDKEEINTAIDKAYETLSSAKFGK